MSVQHFIFRFRSYSEFNFEQKIFFDLGPSNPCSETYHGPSVLSEQETELVSSHLDEVGLKGLTSPKLAYYKFNDLFKS